MSSQESPPTTVDTAEPIPSRRGRVLFTTIAAQSIEYYDFLIYGTAASLVLNDLFFPSGNPLLSTLATFATFAVGFAGRPIGAAIFGHFGDKLGRKPALLAAMVLMAVSSTLIGLLPTYGTIGVVAPVLLVILRIAQGVSVGGHFGGATLLALESAPPKRRGLFGALPQLGVVVGMVTGTLIFLLISSVTTAEQFSAWGWRIPFLLSVLMFPLAYFMHRTIEDTPEFRDADRKAADKKRSAPRSSVVQVLRHPKQILLVAGIFLPAGINFYVIVTGVLHHATSDLGISQNAMLAVLMLSMLAFGVGTVGFAWLSDILGRRKVYGAGAAFAAAWAFALFPLVDTKSFGLILLAASVGQLAVGAMFGPGTALFAEAFPPKIRFAGSAMGNQLANIVGAGLAPFVMVALLAATHTSVSVSVYMAAASVVSLIALVAVRIPKAEVTATAESGTATAESGTATEVPVPK